MSIHIKHPGRLHAKLGVAQGHKIPEEKIEAAAHSSSPALRKEAQFAINATRACGPGHDQTARQVNVFVRVHTTSDLRLHLCKAVLAALALDGVEYEIIQCGPDVSIEQFHFASKRAAAERSSGEHLIIVDDDQLPLYKDWVGYAVSLTKRYPEYAAIAGWSVTNEVPRPAALIEESDSIGCPMIVRREALLDATAEPIDNTARADTIITARLQRHGKTGIARNWRYNHLGMGYSQVIPQHWMPECPA